MPITLHTIVEYNNNIADAVSRIQKSFEYTGAAIEVSHNGPVVIIAVHSNKDLSFMSDTETKRGARLYDCTQKTVKPNHSGSFDTEQDQNQK